MSKSVAKNENEIVNNTEESEQYDLDLGVEVEEAVNGIEMGILENGIPYLTQTGLAEASGMARSVIYDISKEWEDNYKNDVLGDDRKSFIKQYLFEKGYKEKKLYFAVKKDGLANAHHAYPDIVCMAIIEYYAFEKGNQNAVKNYRNFAGYGLQKFIYDALNYSPRNKWVYYLDRVSLLKNSAPDGYFTIFNESCPLIVDLIDAGLTVDDKTIPDGSVGIAWGKYWTKNKLSEKYGERVRYEHNYPYYYPQAASNPQEPFAYPDLALPEFRKWFKHDYLATRFPSYILNKAKELQGGKKDAEKIIDAVSRKYISTKPN